jgi:glycosyltransferase involved in cell wall biosynthesis
MRIGQNPAKAGIKAPQVKSLGIVTITCVPNQEGYFQESMGIIEMVLASLRANTGQDFDLYVFDNGSCSTVQNRLYELKQKGIIDVLTLFTENFGKIGALNRAIASMPNDWIAYSDSDFYFRKGWFDQSMKIAESFPAAAMITAQPNIFDQLEGKSKVVTHLQDWGIASKLEKLDPRAVEAYCDGIGVNAETRQNFLNSLSLIVENPASRVKAVFGACTAQFMGKREMLQKIFPLPNHFLISREEDNEICRAVDKANWLQLSTVNPYVVHIGNHIDDTISNEAKNDNLNLEKFSFQKRSIEHKDSPAWKMLLMLNRVPLLKRIFRRLYVNLFELYSVEKR